ncbi:hypothetical protein L198_00576 [Cryptococcus wingfieldii CBS 7118]|uniref:Peroxisomal biogenesis factor 11 n=1 Tax=Cryptococcus wingfieldii CBS 7118 TaxID=1295528 RepID=A0A1E3K7L1_9TREE|nr:hypothetical protein L198_00576 [Cryptococcus wingfieldii CBS 7118]ODO08843.1 hypothetical protein L198_00576 [Cryptococcus wingfieldii CBS 7118]
MSNIAAEIILHPKVNQTLAVLATTVGRDKVTRLLQYIARLLAWSLLHRGNVEEAARWNGLKGGLANGRKVMRLFRPAEFLQSAINLAQRPGPAQVAHIAQIGRQIGYAGFHTTDMITWLSSIRFLKYDKLKTDRIQRLMYKFWFAGVLSSLISSIASLLRLRADSRRFALSTEVAKREEKEGNLEAASKDAQRETIISQILSDSLDIWIPATGLGLANLSDGTLGLFGVVTSCMGVQAQWNKHSAAGVRKTK